MTAVTPDYTDSADGVGDTFDASVYALSYFETVEGMLVTIPDMVVADGFVSTSGGDPFFQAYSQGSANADQINSRGGYTIAGDPPDRPARHAQTPATTPIQGGRHLHDGDVNPDIIELDFTGFADAAPDRPLHQRDDGRLARRRHRHHRFRLHRPEALRHRHGARRVRQHHADPGSDRARRRHAAASPSPPSTSRISIRATAPRASPRSPTRSPTTSTRRTSSRSRRCRTIMARPRRQRRRLDHLADAGRRAQPRHRRQLSMGRPGADNGAEGGEPGGNIRVGFLYNTDRVQLGDLDANATLAERRMYTDRIGDGVRDAGDLIAFSDNMLGAEINTADWAGDAPLAARRVHLPRQHGLRHRQPLAGQGRLGRILAVQPESRRPAIPTTAAGRSATRSPRTSIRC